MQLTRARNHFICETLCGFSFKNTVWVIGVRVSHSFSGVSRSAVCGYACPSGTTNSDGQVHSLPRAVRCDGVTDKINLFDGSMHVYQVLFVICSSVHLQLLLPEECMQL